MHSNDINHKARELLKQTLWGYDDYYGFGHMSCAVYDTAWVSLITKEVDGKEQWLFPECFEYLLATQSDQGEWDTGSSSQIDKILNTAAGLLALCRHSTKQLQLQHNDLALRIEKATNCLRAALAAWDVSATQHVGFEIIVPAMLEFLEAENVLRSQFNFKGRSQLMKIHDIKMSRFKPEFLYGGKRSTALHSLEAFIGKLDFGRVSHHLINGSMLGSPSSTAAYLMNAPKWDEEAERYLKHVLAVGSGQGTGGMPSAFPTTHFEASWVSFLENTN